MTKIRPRLALQTQRTVNVRAEKYVKYNKQFQHNYISHYILLFRPKGDLATLNKASPPWRNSPQWLRTSSLSSLHDHTQTHHTRQDSSGWVISPVERPLTTHNTQTCPRPDSNPQSEKASGRRPTPYAARQTYDIKYIRSCSFVVPMCAFYLPMQNNCVYRNSGK